MNFENLSLVIMRLLLTLSRQPAAANEGIILTGGQCYTNQFFNPNNPDASALATVGLKPVNNPATASVGSNHYVIGGWFYTWPDQFQSGVQKYDATTSSTVAAPKLTTPRFMHTAVAVDSKLFVCGGMSNWGQMYHLPSCETLDTANEAQGWKPMTAMPNARVDHVSAAIDGKIYVSGGVAAGQYTKSTLYYDTTADNPKWETAADMLQYRDVPASVVLPDGRWLVCGGYDNINAKALKSCEIYDPSSDSWSEAGDMTTTRWSQQIVLFQDEVYILGGMGGPAPKWLDSVEKYDPESGGQEIDAKLYTPCTQFAAFVVE